mgnify:CR=1 FL=1
MKSFKKLISNDAVFAGISSFVLSLLIGALLILILGKNPLTAYTNLLQGSGLFAKAKYGGGQSRLTDLSSFVDSWTPMLFAALACAVALKAGLFNIGISGQMLVAGFISTVCIGYAQLPGILAKPLVILIGMACGAVCGGLIGWLKYRFNINEVVSSIMLIRAGTGEALEKKEELWKYLSSKDMLLYMKLRYGILGRAVNLPGRSGRKLSVAGYKLAHWFVGFN